MTTREITHRIAARRSAELAWSLVVGEADSAVDCVAYWERIRELYAGEFPPPKTPTADPMTCQEAANFNLQKIPFGKNAGQYVGDVPLSYLCHLCDPSPFIDELKRYLKNPEVKRQIDEEDPELEPSTKGL